MRKNRKDPNNNTHYQENVSLCKEAKLLFPQLIEISHLNSKI